MLIGRARERATLSALIAAVKGGEGRVVLINGEAGIGKSRLVAEGRNIASTQGFLVAQGQCFQADVAYPYAPLLEMLRAYLPACTASIRASRQESLVRELAQLLPDLALLLPQFTLQPVNTPTEAHTEAHAEPEQQRQRLFTLLTYLLTSQAAQCPTLLVIEDIHWCDDSTLDFLLHLARRASHSPLILLVTYRGEEVSSHANRWLVQLDRERLPLDLALARLSPPEVDSMIQAICATPGPVPVELAETISTLAEGIPFFVEEMLKSLITVGKLQLADGAWQYTSNAHETDDSAPLIPRSVRGIVRQRVDHLSAAAHQALTLSAVAGRRFDAILLQRLLACDESRLILVMKELIDAQLVVEESADCFAFRHALIQQAIYSTLLARERRMLHGAIAEALEAHYTTTAQREAHLADLSAHFYAASAWEKALYYGQRAAEKSLALHAPRAALEHATQALNAAQHLHITLPGEVFQIRGQARETLGEFGHARNDYERALELAKRDHNDTLQWQSISALGFLWAGRDYAQAGIWFRRASDLAERIDDPAMRARSLNRLGNWLGNIGRIEEGLETHHRALAIFEEQSNPQGMAETLDLLSTLHGMRGERITAVEELGQAIALFRRLGDVQSLTSSLAMRALQSMPGANETTLCPQRTQDECVQDAMESLRLASQTGSLAGQAFAEIVLAHILLSFGEIGAAFAHARAAQGITNEIEHQQWQISSRYALGRIYLLLLVPDQAITALASGLSLARELGSVFWIATLSAYLGRAYLINQDLTAAEVTLQAVMPREQSPYTIAERDIALAWGELALARGEFDSALQRAEELLASAPGQRASQHTQPIPHILQVKGEALMSLSRPDEALAALIDARRGALERDARPLLWTIHRSLGRAYQLRQRYDEARKEIASARRLIEELAATVENTALREHFMRSARATLPKERPIRRREAARQALGGLTTREREVVALVAQGKTSRQIADDLVVSERTAEVHVSNILKKLGLNSRTQIAVWAVERGLTRK
ncbi:MAG TPA: AAA family ATPase [Ktedonobacterales bacterium]|jgi:DNA-binding CsgD family transcriptional regulator